MRGRNGRPGDAPGWSRWRILALTVAIVSAVATTTARANPSANPSINFYGAPGLLDMPDGNMSADGTLRLSVARADFTQRYSLNFQALPWMQFSFRFFVLDNFLNHKAYYDRSFGLKIRLIEEDETWPAISVGALDIVGTALTSGEYVAASKHFGPFDLTIGMGWGKLAGTAMFGNPFGYAISNFKTRKQISALPGTNEIHFGQFFHGSKASLFGGIAWQTPLEGLTVLAEYSSDNYQREALQGAFKPRTQFNVGLSYKLTDWAEITAGWMYGDTAMFQLSLSANPKARRTWSHYGSKPLPAHMRSNDELQKLNEPPRALVEPPIASVGTDGTDFIVFTRGVANGQDICERLAGISQTAHENGFQEIAVSDVDDPAGSVRFCKTRNYGQSRLARASGIIMAADRTRAAYKTVPVAARARAIALANAQGLQIDRFRIADGTAEVAFENRTYRTESEAYGRLSRVLMDTMPPDVERFRFTSLDNGVPMRNVMIPRDSLERVIRARGTGAELLASSQIAPASSDADILSAPLARSYPRFDWAICPELNQSLFDSDRPYRYQILLGLKGGIDLAPGLRTDAEFQVNLVDNFSHLPASTSTLAHVRSDLGEYFHKGRYGIARLQTSYTAKLGSGLYAQARAGYLESMFAGGGGEILWHPDGKRWAIGVTAYEVWQRGFDRLFDLQNYHVFTGHISFYYQSPYYGLNFRVHAGRYLAGDYGATIEILRRFDTGIEIGAFATFTNAGFSKYGEGAFDKGIIIRIPLDWMLPVNSQSNATMTLKPLMRDGGQALEGEYGLYDATTRTNAEPIIQDFNSVVSP